MKRQTVLALALCAAATALVTAQSSPIRPGQWEVNMQMEMAGAPMQMPPMKTLQCITPEQVKDPAAALARGPQGRGGPQDCKVSDYKQTGNTMTWKMACTGQQAMTGTGEMTFKDDTYVGTMKMDSPQGQMTMKMSGKRLGDCPPAK